MIATGVDYVVLLEKLRVFTPLGIRFWDSTLNAQISEGLAVTAYPEGAPFQVIRALRTLSGIYAFHNLPGLHEVEYPSGKVVPTASPPIFRRFVVHVADRRNRFMASVFNVEAPFRGVFPTGFDQPGTRPPGVYLFSAPMRPTMPTLAVVRTQLAIFDGVTTQPAAYAVIEVHAPGGRLWYGLADKRGIVTVLFPYPVFSDALPADDTASPPAPIHQQHWPLNIQVRYGPSTLVWPMGSPVPELSSIFRQPLANLWPSRTVPEAQPVEQMSVQLRFGEELVLRTDSESVLLISPVLSSP